MVRVVVKMIRMKTYYSNRAKIYEEVYFRDDPIRQAELLQIKDVLKGEFSGRDVLEVACAIESFFCTRKCI